MESSSSLKGSQLGKLVLSSGILDLAWSKVSEIHALTYRNPNSGIGIKIFDEANCRVVVFAAPRNTSSNSASTLLDGSQEQNPFYFLCSQHIPSFSLHTLAFQLFFSAYEDLSNLKTELLRSKLLRSKRPLIITGAALGGSVASLFTLWLLESIDLWKKKPLCITFGSPLIGDASLQEILEDSVRGSCFLHVADAAQSPITAGFFKPFGTFLICFDSQCICIDDSETVVELLFNVNADLVDWRDYGKILHRLDNSVLSMGDSLPMSMSDDVIDRMEERPKKEKLLSELIERLKDMKISMAHIKGYIRSCKKAKISFYDCFKTQTASPSSPVSMAVTKCKNELNNIWKSLVEELEKRVQSDILILKSARSDLSDLSDQWFLFSANNYRRMIEPLDIAEYYLSGREEYRTLGRSRHYVMLEKWFGPYGKELTRSARSDLSDLLTFDSCFWAEVEEAMVVINLLKTQVGMRDEERELSIGKLVRFEEYVWKMIHKREVSPEIFLEKSSFMKWWKEYIGIKGRDGFNSSFSAFTEFMITGRYQNYGSGDIFYRGKVDSLASARVQGKTPMVAHFQNWQCPPIVIDENSSDPIILKAAREKTGEEECVVVFSCNDNLDVEETSFIKCILKELHEREVTSLTCNLDEEMLYKPSVGIMVLSNSFARSSRHSLDNLVALMEYWKAKYLVIIPIYFKVTHADICRLEDRFEAVYLHSVQTGRVQKWKAAMTELASIDGHEWTKGTEVMLAEEVVRNACLRLYLKSSKNLARTLGFLNHSHPSDAEIVGLWGMAGIGKTSIAREIFGTLAPQYDLCYFLQDFHLMCQEKGLRQMRDDFFSKVFGEEKPSISACDIKPSFMKDWFHNKTILVVLDDVSYSRDAEAVVGGFDWFSHGHRIILTSRRKQVLVQCKVKEPYEIQKLCETESFRLCKLYLNGERVAISELMSCSSGIPLALKVLGSSASKQPINNMMGHLQRLRRNPPTLIQETFRRSFDGLDENEKNIFLDLACFFRGENMDHVVQLLDACGFLTYLGICNLIDESLISLLDNRIEIPVPFQDMGRFIVHQEDKDPCERSRLWDSNDIANVLTKNSGTEAIEGIFLDASDLNRELSTTVFSKMYRLRLLKFYCSTSGDECKLSLPQGLDTLPDELRLLHWENYPLKCLPQKFNPENLVEVNMPYSKLEKLWEGKKNLEMLKKIKLSHSRKLTDILMLSEALNIEHIDLEGCSSIVDVSTSIPRCEKLVSLNMKDCSHLRSLPAMFDFTSLKLLNMSGCSELEEIQDFAPNLKELYLAGTAIRELPLSIENLTELVTLDLENCGRLQQLPVGIRNSRSIVELKLAGCTSLELRKRKR